MSDEQTPADVQDTSVVATPAGGTEDTINWEQRYHDLHPEFTRKAQRLAQFEDALEGLHSDDPDTRMAAAQALGIELAEDEDASLLDDPSQELQQRLARIEQAYAMDAQAREAQQAEQRDLEIIGQGLKTIQEQIGRDLTPDEIGLLGDAAWSNRDEHGLPNISHVGQMYAQTLANVAPRQRPKAPHVSAGGAQAEHASRLGDTSLNHSDRVEAMMEALQANEL